jgi:protein-S-isoprenylcysteine O-methyltransferase Ste14
MDSPWWRGARGEWYVAAQLVLIAVVFFGPRTMPGLPIWPDPIVRTALCIGVVLGLTGIGLLLAGICKIGSRLTPLPCPKSDTRLIQSGPYRLVRHPMYFGGIMLAYGWALVVHGWLTLGYATVIVIFLDIKSRREERWLMEKFPEYRDYQKRVRKLIPFIH